MCNFFEFWAVNITLMHVPKRPNAATEFLPRIEAKGDAT